MLDTTNLPTDWATYSITLDLSDPLLQGQILQFGFSTIASNFEGAGNFYDNISFCTDAAGGGCTVDADCPDTGNDCTAGACVAGNCETVNVADGTSCDSDTGTCSAGVCEPTGPVACVYEQDFEALDPAGPAALSDDGWLYFGNVFNSTGGFKFGFGPFAAPTISGQISGIATGEGGPDQGNEPTRRLQQLRLLPAGRRSLRHRPGRDHCLPGDRLDPRGFHRSDLHVHVRRQTRQHRRRGRPHRRSSGRWTRALASPRPTTSYSIRRTFRPDWATYSITIDLSDPLLQGQILQFGYSTVASNFEPAGNFYDNASFGVEGCGGGGGPGPGGELTTNGDFEAGDTSGWEFFPNDGTFAATMAQRNGGLWSGNLVASVPAGGGPPSFPVIKQANIGIGSVQPNSSCDISFDLFGSVSGAGGVFFAEFFSELSGGGTSSSVILGGGPLFPNGTWTNYTFNYAHGQ